MMCGHWRSFTVFFVAALLHATVFANDTSQVAASNSALEAAYHQLKHGDTKQGLVSITQLAEDGDAVAQTLLGDIYASGHLVPQNFQTAARWRTLAARQGDAIALNALGKHFAEGYGVPADVVKAEQYLTAAAANGEAAFQFDVGLLYDNPKLSVYNPERAVQWYQLSAAQGYTAAQANLGMLLFEGRVVEQDLVRAKALLTQAAKAGHDAAQNNLGIMYVRGEGVDQNYEQAFYWFSEAAEQGHKAAMANLAVMYDNGLGVAFNEEMAKQLNRSAAQQSHNSLGAAIDTLDYTYDDRLRLPETNTDLTYLQQQAATQDPVALYQLGWYWLQQAATPDYSLARRMLEKAAAAGMRSAMFNLGLMSLKGRGVPQDFVQGYRWINQAAALNLPVAATARNVLLPFMTPKQLEQAQSQ